MTRASGGVPKRMQTSNDYPVSVSGLTKSWRWTSICGWSRTGCKISGAMCERPQPSVALTRSRPRGEATAAPPAQPAAC